MSLGLRRQARGFGQRRSLVACLAAAAGAAMWCQTAGSNPSARWLGVPARLPAAFTHPGFPLKIAGVLFMRSIFQVQSEDSPASGPLLKLAGGVTKELEV